MLQSKSIGFSEPMLLTALGLLNLGAAYYTYRHIVRAAE
jgi:hypothetical protein